MKTKVKKEYQLLFFSLFLIIFGLLVSMFGEVGYLNVNSQVQYDYFTRKSRLEDDRIRGSLPAKGIDSYANKSLLLENEYKYNLAKAEVMNSTNLARTIGNAIASIGFWALPASLIFMAIVNTELSEKEKLALLIGSFALFILVAYGHTVTFDLNIRTTI